MNLKHGLAGALLSALLGTPLVSAQAPMLLPPVKETSAVAAVDAPAVETVPDGNVYGVFDPNAPVKNKYAAATCCGPVGGNGPVNSEPYFRIGPSFVLSDTAFGKSLRTGYELQGGGRSMFFNPDRTGAFIVDLGVNYTYNNGHPESVFDFSGAPVTIRSLHRTSAALGLGYDWFLAGPGSTGCLEGRNFRVGFDGGARWGTAHLDMNFADVPGGYQRNHDVYAAYFAAIHADLVVPVGAWNFTTGVRGQWSYSSLSLIPGTDTHLNDLSVLLTFGVQW